MGEKRTEVSMGCGGCIATICLCPATSEYDTPCPVHGVRPIGMRGDGSYVPGECEGATARPSTSGNEHHYMDVGELEELKARLVKADAEVARLRDELTKEHDVSRQLRSELAVVRTDEEGVWYWQGDGYDHPESLSCPVVMSASTLREIVAARYVSDDEREACAKVAESFVDESFPNDDQSAQCRSIAASIRARTT